jgi:hypothetical protein
MKLDTNLLDLDLGAGIENFLINAFTVDFKQFDLVVSVMRRANSIPVSR